jgi:excisionase family DNA binding protein
MSSPDRLIRLAEAANLLALNKDVVRDMADAGKIPHVKTPGGHRRFRLSDIHEMMGIADVNGSANIGRKVFRDDDGFIVGLDRSVAATPERIDALKVFSNNQI